MKDVARGNKIDIDEKNVVEMYMEDKITQADIALELGISKSTVSRIIHRHVSADSLAEFRAKNGRASRPVLATEHGTASMYDYGCTCEPCRLAGTQRRTEMLLNQDDEKVKHGTARRYRLGCRCGACRTAKELEYMRSQLYGRETTPGPANQR